MINNPVIEAIYAAFKLEIANQFDIHDNILELTLPDQQRLMIAAPKVNTVSNTEYSMPNVKYKFT